MFEFNSKNTKWDKWYRSVVFIINFQQSSHFIKVFILPTLNSQMTADFEQLKEVFFFVIKIVQYCEWKLHCMKSVQIRSYFWSVFSCIQSKYRKIQTRNNSVFGHFSRSAWLIKNIIGGNIYLSLTKRQTKHFQHCGWNRVLWIRVKKSHWKVIYKHRCSTVLLFFTQSYI